jgi:hypothetical protein
MVRTSYLRVYQPLDSFPEAERKRFASAGRAPQTESRTRRAWLVHSAMPSPAVEYPAGLSDGAFVRTVDEAILVCPWRTRLRMLAGLIAFRVSVPVEVADAFVPANEAERAAAELEIIGEFRLSMTLSGFSRRTPMGFGSATRPSSAMPRLDWGAP